MLNVQDSEFIAIKGFTNPISKKILIVLAPTPKGDYNYNFILDRNDRDRIMNILEVDNPFKIEFLNIDDGFGTESQAINHVDNLKLGFKTLGYTTTIIGTSFIGDDNILHINWK